MSDQEQPTFKVVDRRRAAQEQSEETDSPSGASRTSEPDSPDTTTAPSTDESPLHSDSTPESTEEEEVRNLPDPTYLLSLAAMQMDTHVLLQALVPILDGHAWRSMGFITDPRTGETHTDLASAQLAIDTIHFLFGKVETYLPESERREVQRRISDLRMNYLTQKNKA